MVLYFSDILVILFSVSFVIIAYILMWIIVPEALEQSKGETMHWKDKQPIYKQLKEKIIEAIVDGSYPEGGEVIPSIRKISTGYRINPLIVSKAYQSLVDEKVIENSMELEWLSNRAPVTTAFS